MSEAAGRRWPARAAFALLGLAACATCKGSERALAVPGAAREVVFTGMCDASGAVPLSASRFAVADDEGNVLRVYDADRGGAPIDSIDLSAAAGPAARSQQEGARASPHPRPTSKRRRASATSRSGSPATRAAARARSSPSASASSPPSCRRTERRSRSRAGLRRRWSTTCSPIARFARFRSARARPSSARRSPGGLNIEGMTERPEGGVWIGFRNPIPGGKALLFALRQPASASCTANAPRSATRCCSTWAASACARSRTGAAAT